MNQDMDFLPASYRVRSERRRSRNSTLMLLGIVSGAILLTEGALRLRIQGLRSTRDHASQQTAMAALRIEQAEELNRRQQAVLEELADWAAPLEAPRATEVLDGILSTRPDSIRLQEIDWQSSSPRSEGQETLRISGLLNDLSDLVAFLTAMERTGKLPGLEVKRSSMTGVPGEHSLQTFMVESAPRGEGAR